MRAAGVYHPEIPGLATITLRQERPDEGLPFVFGNQVAGDRGRCGIERSGGLEEIQDRGEDRYLGDRRV